MNFRTPEEELVWLAEQQNKLSAPAVMGVEQGLIPFVKAAIEKGFHVFPLTPKDKHPLPCSQGFKDSRSPDDALVLTPWNQDSNRNIGIDLGASDLCVLDFDKPESIPPWLNAARTYKVRSAKGVHIYFRGARKTSKLYVDNNLVGDIKSQGGYVLAEGSVHPDGPIYTAIDNSPIADLPERVSELVKHDSKRVNASPDGPPIPRGSHDTELTRIAGVMRNAGFTEPKIEEHLVDVCERRCENYGSDYRDMCKKIAHSIGKKPVGQASPTLQFEATPQEQKQTGRVLSFVRGDSIKPMRLRWLWNNRVLADKLNVFSGEPDVGKGMTTVDFAARITRHWDFPDCKNELEGPRDVLFLSSEDDMGDTIVPRLKVAGADMARIHFAEISENSSGTLTEGIVCLDRDLPVLEEMIKKHSDIVLIIPDPVIAFLGDADPNKDKEVRPIYSKMKAFAKRLNVGWLFVNHWNKNQNATSINRTSGAKTMVSAPRATWMFSKSPEDPTRYLMMKGKGNLSSLSGAKTLAYRIVSERYDFGDGKPPGEVPKLVWDGETEHAVDTVLRDQADPTKRRNGKAEDFLVKLLEPGAMKAKDVYRAGDKQDLDDNQMKRARYRLGYVADQIDGVWYWAKSDEDIASRKLKLYTPGETIKLDVSFDAPPTVN
jgi:AAA domain/Bifunctional DNA primase/polymerase, N-terminal